MGNMGFGTSEMTIVSSSDAYINVLLALFILEKPAKYTIHSHYPTFPAALEGRFPAMRLLPHTSILLTASAASVPLQPRGDRCEGDPDPPVIGPSTDGAAGIGAEFESPAFYFKSDCSDDDTFASKGKVIGERTGPNWALTADTGGQGGRLNAEYVLSGKDIKVGSGDAAKAGKAIADDLVSTAATHPYVLPVNVARLVGTRGPETGHKPSTLQIANATRGRSMAQQNARNRSLYRGHRR